MRGLRLLIIGIVVAASGGAYGAAISADQRLADVASLDEVAKVFVPEPEWQRQEVVVLQEQLRESLAGNGCDRIFLPDADIGPLSKALLIVLNEEPALPHKRYRLRYAMARVTPEGRPPLTAELVEVTRFNLGPARRAELIETLGEAQVAPAADFGQSPGVSWRLITRPIMGQVADITHLARRELSEQHVENCLGLPCQDAGPLNDVVREWPSLEPVDLALDHGPFELSVLQAGLERVGYLQRDAHGRTSWRAPEWPESVLAGEPFIEIALEGGLGQDDTLDLVIHHDQLMDDHTRALWERLVVLGAGDAALIVTTSDHEPWPRLDW